MTSNKSTSSGFSLIEVMIATAVFSIGMGGMSALVLSAAGGISESEHETTAHLHADAKAAMWQLSPLALNHLANPPGSAPRCFEDDICSNEEFSLGRYLRWQSQANQLLPDGEAVICRDSTPADGQAGSHECDGSGPIVSKVFWSEPRKEHEPDGGVRRTIVQIPK